MRRLSDSQSCIAFKGFSPENGQEAVAQFDTCGEEYYSSYIETLERWYEVSEGGLTSKYSKQANGDVKLEFIKEWPMGT